PPTPPETTRTRIAVTRYLRAQRNRPAHPTVDVGNDCAKHCPSTREEAPNENHHWRVDAAPTWRHGSVAQSLGRGRPHGRRSNLHLRSFLHLGVSRKSLV